MRGSVSRRAALAAAAGAAAWPLLARAQNTPLRYGFPGAAPDRGLGLAPRAQCTAGTLQQTEGPFYTPNTPRRAVLREPGTIRPPLVFQGLVVDRECRPLPGAVVDVWHADEDGVYDNAGFRYRGHQFTDAAGAFRFETVRPGLYPGRTPHIHVKVQGEGTRLLTTQVYFPDLAQANARDRIYRDDLLVQLTRSAEGWSSRFDFVLATAEA